MSEELEQLAALDGVTGLFLHRGGIIKWQRRPDSLATDSAASLCHAVSRAFASYAQGERGLTQAYFEFDSQSVLVIARKPDTTDEGPLLLLTFLLRNRMAATQAISAATAYFESGSVN